jgi:hypothetical protein
MEPEGLSPYSQEPATCPCPGPDWSSPCLASNLSKIHFNIILPSLSAWKNPKTDERYHELRPIIYLLLNNFVTSICI